MPQRTAPTLTLTPPPSPLTLAPPPPPQLGNEDRWFCPKCQKNRSAMKKIDIWEAPEVLVIQLKRFRYIQGRFFVQREKIDSLVEFPTKGLDLSPYVRGPQAAEAGKLVYDLFAVSEHSGSLSGGHCTAVAKNFMNNQWFNFNDSEVSGSTAESTISPRAYVLFYQVSSLCGGGCCCCCCCCCCCSCCCCCCGRRSAPRPAPLAPRAPFLTPRARHAHRNDSGARRYPIPYPIP